MTQHSNSALNKRIVIQISDTGDGIPAEHLNKIFNPFFTTKQTGTGLGLTTAMDVINSHGSFIEVTSAEEIGTEFRVFLPARLNPRLQ